MKIRNSELRELNAGLAALKNIRAVKEDSETKRAAAVVIANRVGRAIRQLRDALDTLTEQEQDLAVQFAKKTPDGAPVQALDDKGSPVGYEMPDLAAFLKARLPLLRETIEVPDLKPVSYELLAKADVYPDGELAGALGDFLTGEPIEPTAAPVAVNVGAQANG